MLGCMQIVKQQIVEITLNGSEVRYFAQVLHVSPMTVIQELKKLAHLKPISQNLLQWLKHENVEVDVVGVEEPKEASIEKSELDEMWGYVDSKKNPRCLWYAIDRSTGQGKRLRFWSSQRRSVSPTEKVT